MFFDKKLFSVKWVSTFTDKVTVNHAAFVVARTAKQAAKIAKREYNIAEIGAAKVTEHGEACLHQAEVNLVPGAAILKESK
jgi:hypothetical protein